MEERSERAIGRGAEGLQLIAFDHRVLSYVCGPDPRPESRTVF
jgi:hypothetical protein